MYKLVIYRKIKPLYLTIFFSIGPFLQALDSQELSFLHLKVCRTWKNKLSKEEALKKRIDSLENELMNKQRYAKEHSK